MLISNILINIKGKIPCLWLSFGFDENIFKNSFLTKIRENN